MSFAIEFFYLPDFAGNDPKNSTSSTSVDIHVKSGTPSSPGVFTDNLLNNIGNISGTKPYVRVGGNSQDLAIYDATLQNATQAVTITNSLGIKDFQSVKIGNAFFDSFKTWPGVKFIYGLNLQNASTSAAGWHSLMDTVPLACKALDSNLLYWEYGNEPDFYPRPKSAWNDDSYVSAWANGTAAIKAQLSTSCPTLASDAAFGLMGPSLAEAATLPPTGIFKSGYNSNGSVKLYALHNYMGDCARQPCNLQADLMNHSAIVQNLKTSVSDQITPLNNGPLINPTNSKAVLPFVLGETNSFLSLVHGPPTGFANAFGAALWSVDYLLQAAAIGIARVHLQQGTGFGYGSWQPLATKFYPKGPWTAPAYYGNVFVASVLGDIPRDRPQVVEVSLPNADPALDAAYACYANGSTLARIGVVNLRGFNASSSSGSSNDGGSGGGGERGSKTYSFSFPSGSSVKEGQSVLVQRLMASGSDATSNVTFDGWSYDYELDMGRPVKVGSGAEERLMVQSGVVSVQVEDSGAAILNFV